MPGFSVAPLKVSAPVFVANWETVLCPLNAEELLKVRVPPETIDAPAVIVAPPRAVVPVPDWTSPVAPLAVVKVPELMTVLSVAPEAVVVRPPLIVAVVEPDAP